MKLSAAWRRFWRGSEQVSAAAEPRLAAILPARRSRRISDTVLARARTRPAAQRVHPFVLPQHPPGVAPRDPGMAMDDANGTLAWAAQQAASSAFAEGQMFLGFTDLAELAQRPEYRRISETIARHMTRKWIKLQAKGDADKSDKIAKIEEAMKRLGVQEAFKKVAEQDGFFGRGHLYLDLGTSDERDELKTAIGDGWNDASKAKVKKGSLKAVKPIEAVWSYPLNYNSNDPLKPDWYKPTQWYVMGKQIHASRFLTFVGREVPDILKPAYSFGGLSLSQMAKPYVDNWLRTRQSVADIVNAFSVSVLKTDMANALEADDGEQLFRRLDFFNSNRDNRGVFAVDKETEDFVNVSASLSTLDALQAQSQEHVAAIAAIPLVEYTGITPSGLNASSEGEIRTFYTWIHSCQESLFRQHLTTVLGFIMLSEFSAVDPDITFEFEPLWSLDEQQAAEKRAAEANVDVAYVDAGILSREEVRQRLASDPDTPYHGIDPDDVPELPSELDPLPDGEGKPGTEAESGDDGTDE